MDFSTWTKQDFINFDKRREEVMQPTKEEIEQQEKQHLDWTINKTKELLSPYGIGFTGTEKDFKKLWKQYIQGDKKSEKNKPMNERLGKDERLVEIVEEKGLYNNNLKDFCNFVIQYEI